MTRSKPTVSTSSAEKLGVAEPDAAADERAEARTGSLSRRSFIAAGVAAGAVATVAPLEHAVTAVAANRHVKRHGDLHSGDAAILRFLAAAEIIEADLWQQYNELGGIQDKEVPGGSGSPAYVKALEELDSDMSQYIHDNTDDEFSHSSFINAFLKSRGAERVDLDRFRVLPSSKATGAQQIGRLTNLMELTVDTSWWTRYRSDNKNPDLGDSFSQVIPGLSKGTFAAIPRSDADLQPHDHIQAIANTAGFHFCFIEQGGTSLYPSLAQRVSDPEILRVLLSIGPTEAMHFQTWHDKAGNAPPLTDPTNGLEFPNLNEPPLGGEQFQTNLIMPEPTSFLKKSLPIVSIVRPTETKGAATGAVEALTADGLFKGQSDAFFGFIKELAREADAAKGK
jgi:Ferritin-like domain